MVRHIFIENQLWKMMMILKIVYSELGSHKDLNPCPKYYIVINTPNGAKEGYTK